MNSKSKQAKAEQGKTITLRLTKSVIGSQSKQRACLQSLGLRKLQQQVTVADNASIRGMINKVKHLVTVEE